MGDESLFFLLLENAACSWGARVGVKSCFQCRPVSGNFIELVAHVLRDRKSLELPGLPGLQIPAVGKDQGWRKIEVGPVQLEANLNKTVFPAAVDSKVVAAKIPTRSLPFRSRYLRRLVRASPFACPTRKVGPFCSSTERPSYGRISARIRRRFRAKAVAPSPPDQMEFRKRRLNPVAAVPYFLSNVACIMTHALGSSTTLTGSLSSGNVNT